MRGRKPIETATNSLLRREVELALIQLVVLSAQKLSSSHVETRWTSDQIWTAPPMAFQTVTVEKEEYYD